MVFMSLGGTFLFVATAHILPDVLANSGTLTWPEVRCCIVLPYNVTHSIPRQVGLLTIATMAPLFINIAHGH